MDLLRPPPTEAGDRLHSKSRCAEERQPEMLLRDKPVLRLLFIQPQGENAGAQEVARLLARGLSRRAYLVKQAFFFRRTAMFKTETEAAYCGERRPSNPVELIVLLTRLFREVRRYRPEVVICFQHYGNVIGALVARLAGARLILANQNSAALNTPRVVHLLDRWLGRVGLYDRIITVSAADEGRFRDYPRHYKARMIRIDHGVELKRSSLLRCEARSKFRFPQRAIALGFVGRLHPLKNLDAAIRLLTLEPSWTLALVGQGADEERLRRQARELGCESQIMWVGELDAEGVSDFLAAIDVFVFPSLSETFGLAAVEAAQAGVPVVANDLPVLRQVLSVDGEPCALFADVANVHSFREAVATLLYDKAAAQVLTEKALRLAARYPIESMVDAYDSLIRNLALEGRK